MPARDELATRIRSFVALDPRITERKMFGSVAFLLNGHILVSARGKGGMMVQCGAEAGSQAATQPGVATMVMRGREMAGFVCVDDDQLEADDALQHWIGVAERYVAALKEK
jgi:hypothetical protein